MRQPLNLPAGSVRAVLALLVVLTGCVLAVVGQILGRPVPESFIAIMSTVVGYYVGTRQGAGKEGPDVP